MGREREVSADNYKQLIACPFKRTSRGEDQITAFTGSPNIPDEGGKYLFEHGGRKLVISVFSAERDRT
jgi:hypothetical protein